MYDELALDTLGDKKTALFLIMSDTDSTFNFLISIEKAAEGKRTECRVFCFAHQEKSTLPGVPKGTG